MFHSLAHNCSYLWFVSTKGTEIILLEGALLVFPGEVWMAEVDAGGNRPEQKFKHFNLFFDPGHTMFMLLDVTHLAEILQGYYIGWGQMFQ